MHKVLDGPYRRVFPACQTLVRFSLLSTSDEEGFPQTFLEAWSHGTPVVTLGFRSRDVAIAIDGVPGGTRRLFTALVANTELDARTILQHQFEDLSDNDESRLDIWRFQLVLDRAQGDTAAVAGDRATLGAIEDRIGSR